MNPSDLVRYSSWEQGCTSSMYGTTNHNQVMTRLKVTTQNTLHYEILITHLIDLNRPLSQRYIYEKHAPYESYYLFSQDTVFYTPSTLSSILYSQHLF